MLILWYVCWGCTSVLIGLAIWPPSKFAIRASKAIYLREPSGIQGFADMPVRVTTLGKPQLPS